MIRRNLFNIPIDNSIKQLNELTHLTLGYSYDQPIINFPSSLTHLTLGYKFNQKVKFFPKSLIYLSFGNSFNNSVNSLGKSLTFLIFDNNFNRPTDWLPNNLTHLIFGNSFNQSTEWFPKNLTHLVFGNSFNYPIDNLSSKLIYIRLGHSFNYSIDKLPDGLNYLIIESKLFNKPIRKYPNNLYVLGISPEKLFSYSIDNKSKSVFVINFLPKQISNLIFFGICSNISEIIIPYNIQKIVVDNPLHSCYFEQLIKKKPWGFVFEEYNPKIYLGEIYDGHLIQDIK